MRITWLMRTTLHLVHAADLEWLHPLFAPRQVTGNVRRLKQLGVSEEQADRAVELIAERVPAKRPELASHLAAHDIPVAGQAIAHLVHRAALRGRVALTPGPRVRFVGAARAGRPRRRAGRARPPLLRVPRGRDRRRPRLLVRPAGPRCALAAWTRRGTTARSRASQLPAFDELLLGWRDRTPTVPAEFAKRVHPGGGILRPVILEDGVAVGTWSARGETLW